MPHQLTLHPNTSLQFTSFEMPERALARKGDFYIDRPQGSNREAVLRILEKDSQGVEVSSFFWTDPQTGARCAVEKSDDNPDIFRRDKTDVLKLLKNEWIPIPVLAFTQEPNGERVYQPGPTNWVRARLRDALAEEITQPDAEENREMRPIITELVFDTTLEEKENTGSASLSEESKGQSFALLTSRDLLPRFVKLKWVQDWLKALYAERLAQDSLKKFRRLPPEEKPAPTEEEYLEYDLLKVQASYLMFLEMLDEAGKTGTDTTAEAGRTVYSDPRYKHLHPPGVPEVTLAEDDKEPIKVDLVLDLGNFRSFGILVEQGNGADLSNSYPLELLDLTYPALRYSRPFSSRVEFAQASFGSEERSFSSGRTGAFNWPSPVRTGPQAVRLLGEGCGADGATGISSPKRYLWDTRPRLGTESWKFNDGDLRRMGAPGLTGSRPVEGRYFRKPLEELLGKKFFRVNLEDKAAARRLGPCLLSRSELFILMAVEILLQALRYINAPENLEKRRNRAHRRRLHSLKLTMPPGMPVAEQRIFKKRAETALKLVEMLLSPPGSETGPNGAIELEARIDEATATQIVWLHNEITDRLVGESRTFDQLYGHATGEKSREITLASMDIGGGTTDLMITTYHLDPRDDSPSPTLIPEQKFRESYRVAGDDVVRDVLQHVILAELEKNLKLAGLPNAGNFLPQLLKANQGNESAQDRYNRHLLVSTLLEPAALAALEIYEHSSRLGEEKLGRPSLEALLKNPPRETFRRQSEFLNRRFLEAGLPRNSGFDWLSSPIELTRTGMERAILRSLGKPLQTLCQAVRAYNCDILLLSGRPSRLRRVRDLIIAASLLQPTSIIPMYDYEAGPRYPYRDEHNRIGDPKTTVAVGAALCALLAQKGRVNGLSIKTNAFKMDSTARYLGELNGEGQMRAPDGLAEIRTEDKKAPDFSMTSFKGDTLIGFRQIRGQDWGATPLYAVRLRDGTDASKLKMPLKLFFKYDEDQAEDTDEEETDSSARELITIDKASDSAGEDIEPHRFLELRLQTMLHPKGYWRDTGAVY